MRTEIAIISALALVLSVPVAFGEIVETKGQNYDLVENFFIGEAVWESHPERIMDGGWQNYALSNTGDKVIFNTNAVGSFIFDKNSCSYSIYGNGFDGEQIIPSVSAVATYLNNGQWQNLPINDEACTVTVEPYEDGVFLTSTKVITEDITEDVFISYTGTTQNFYSNSTNSQFTLVTNSTGNVGYFNGETITTTGIEVEKFVQEIRLDIRDGFKETFKVTHDGSEELGISQTIHSGESITIGDQTINIAELNGQSFDRQFIIDNEAEILAITDSVNYDFDTGIESLSNVNIIFDGDYKVNMDFADGGFVGYLEIDPTITLSGTTKSTYASGGGAYSGSNTAGYIGGDGAWVYRSGFYWDISSISDSATITNTELQWDTSYSNGNSNLTCDVNPISGTLSTDGGSTIHADVASGTPFIDDDSFCAVGVSTGNTLDLGSTATSDLESHLSTDEWGIGIVQQPLNTLSLRLMDFANVELQVTYTVPIAPQPPTGLTTVTGIPIELDWDSPLVTTNYKVHSFTTVGTDTFQVTAGSGDVDYLIIGGGGAGGESSASNGVLGGGGAGAYITATSQAVTAQSYSITVGDGGDASTTSINGGDSSFDGVTANGGAGASKLSNNAGNANGNASGSGASGTYGSTSTGGAGGTYGNDGGTSASQYWYSGSGGGGSSGVGQDSSGGSQGGGVASGVAGNGGAGTANSITGSEIIYAVGGGGGTYSTGTGGLGSVNGDGQGGGTGNGVSYGKDGTDGLGNGGGGASYGANVGGDGGTGTVIIRYVDDGSITATGGTVTTITESNGGDGGSPITGYKVYRTLNEFALTELPDNSGSDSQITFTDNEFLLHGFESGTLADKSTNSISVAIGQTADTSNALYDNLSDTTGGQSLFTGSDVIGSAQINSGSTLIGTTVFALEIPLFGQGSPTGEAIGGVFDSSGNLLHEFGRVDVSTLPTQSSVMTAPFPTFTFEGTTGYTLSSGENIGVKFEPTGTSNTSHRIFTRTSSSDNFDGSNTSYGARSATAWTYTSTAFDFAFKLYGGGSVSTSTTGVISTGVQSPDLSYTDSNLPDSTDDFSIGSWVKLNPPTPPTYEDDFSSSNTLDNDDTKITVANNRWEFDNINDSTPNDSSLDLGVLSDSTWLLDYDLTFSTITSSSDVNTSFITISSLDSGTSSQSAQDGISLRVQVGGANSFMPTFSNNGILQANTGTPFTTTPSETTYYVRVIRDSATQFTTYIYDNPDRTSLTESEVYSNAGLSSVNNLRYLKISPYESGTYTSKIVGFIDNVKIYNGVTSVPVYNPNTKLLGLNDVTFNISTDSASVDGVTSSTSSAWDLESSTGVTFGNSLMNEGTGAWTLSTWVNMKDSSNGWIMSKYGGNDVGWALVAHQGQGYYFEDIDYPNYWITLNSNIAPTSGTWEHVVVTRSTSGDFVIYVNGSQENTGSSTQNIDNTSTFKMGYDSDEIIDDLTIWERELSASEVLSLYENGNDSISQTGLIHHYDFEQTSGNLLDQIGSIDGSGVNGGSTGETGRTIISPTTIISATGLTDNTSSPQHYTFTRDGNDWEIYQNGVSEATATDSTSLGAGGTIQLSDSNDFSTDNMVDSDSSKIGITNGVFQQLWVRDSTNDASTYTLSNNYGNEFNMKFEFTTNGLNGYSSGFIGMFSEDNTVDYNDNQDFIGLFFNDLVKIQLYSFNDAYPSGLVGSSWITLTANTDYYVEIIGNGDDTYNMNLRTGSHTGSLVTTQTITNSGITGLEYFGAKNTVASGAGSTTTQVDNLSITAQGGTSYHTTNISGMIDEYFVNSDVLTATEIDDIYERGVAPTLLTTTGASTTEHDDGTVVGGNDYYFTLKSTNAIGDSDFLTPFVSGLAGTPADPPSSVSSSINNPNTAPLDITVSWSSPTNVGSGTLTGFEIYRDSVLIDTVGLVTSYPDTVPSGGGTFEYKLKSLSTHGTSGFSSTTSTTTPTIPPTPTATPTLAIDNPNPSPLDIDVSWSAQSSGGSAITGYEIFRSADDITFTSVGTVTDLDFTDTVPSAGTWYYTFASTNLVGSSGQSPSNSITTATVPSSPLNASSVIPSINSAPYDVTVSWDLPTSTGGSALTGYNVYRQTGSGAFTLVDTTTALGAVNTVPSALNQDYTFKIHSLSNVGESTGFVTTTITTGDVPDAPVLSFTTGTTSLSWTVPSSDASITGYKIFRDSVLLTTVTTTTHSDFTTIVFGNSYDYKIVAVSSLGDSADSNTITTTPETEITGMIAQGITGTGAVIDWDEPAYYQGQITNYEVYYSEITASVTTPTTSAGTTTNTYSNFAPNLDYDTTYIFGVKVNSPLGNSGFSNYVTVTTSVDGSIVAFDPTVGGMEWFDIDSVNEQTVSVIQFQRETQDDMVNGTNIVFDTLQVAYPSWWDDMTCDVDYKFAQKTEQYVEGEDMTSLVNPSDANQQIIGFQFHDIDNEVIEVECAPQQSQQDDGVSAKYVMTQNSFGTLQADGTYSTGLPNIPLVTQITNFTSGEYGTDGDFGAVDIVGLFVILVSMVGFNRVSPIVGVLISASTIFALSFFGLITIPTIIVGAIALVIFLAWGIHRKR